MGAYDLVKDAVKMANAAGNIDIIQKLIDVQQQLLDMQSEISTLREENKRLLDNSELKSKVIRYKSTYITFSDDENKTLYCSCCWDCKEKTVQLKRYPNSLVYKCPNCSNQSTGLPIT